MIEAQIRNLAPIVRVLHQQPEHPVEALLRQVGRIADLERDAERFRAASEHVERLREARSETRNTALLPAGAFFVCTRCSIVIASAAAVASSSSDAFAMSIPVRSLTIVWKFSSDSSRPCAISA